MATNQIKIIKGGVRIFTNDLVLTFSMDEYESIVKQIKERKQELAMTFVHRKFSCPMVKAVGFINRVQVMLMNPDQYVSVM